MMVSNLEPSREETEALRRSVHNDFASGMLQDLWNEQEVRLARLTLTNSLLIKSVISLNAGFVATVAALLSDTDRNLELSGSLGISVGSAVFGIFAALIALTCSAVSDGKTSNRIGRYRLVFRGHSTRIALDPEKHNWKNIEPPEKASLFERMVVVPVAIICPYLSSLAFLVAVFFFFRPYVTAASVSTAIAPM